MIKNIIFDFGGVLLDLRPDRCIEEFKKIGIPEVEQMLNIAHQKGVLDNVERGQYTLAEFCDVMRDVHAGPDSGNTIPTPTNRQIIHAFCSMADGIPPYRLDFVQQLRTEGYQISMLSNTNQMHWGYCQRYFLEAGFLPEELFDYVWLSCDLQMVKPDPEIFRAILSQSGYNPDETLFVDDNQKNCQIAEQLGIHSFCAPIRTDWTSQLRQYLMK